MVRKVIFLLVLTGFINLGFAQEFPEIDKGEFKVDGRDGFKDAWKMVKGGDYYYEAMDLAGYRKAVDFYVLAHRYNPRSEALNYKLGVSYLLSTQKTNSIKYLESAYKKNKNIAIDIEYMLARAYQLNYEFDKAIEYYKKFRQTISDKKENKYAKYIEKYINECNNGKLLSEKTARAFITNAGDALNSTHKDHTPVITADESVMFFTSRRMGFADDDVDPYDGEFYENIFESHHKDDKWTKPEMVKKVCSKKQHDATISITPDGQHMYIYRSDNDQGDIYESRLKGDKWSSPKKLPKVINTKYHETSACLSYDGKELYFTSNRPDKTLGESDIYVCTKNEKGEWAHVKNIGGKINTPYKEESVFFMPDGRTMYFSSEGHNTMGGLDIFKVTRDENGNWGVPENLGMPINTPDNDVFLVLSASGKHGYYASVRDDSQGSADIYLVTFMGPEKPQLTSVEDNLIAAIANPVSEAYVQPAEALSMVNLTILKGIIKDKGTFKPLEAEIVIVDNEKNEVVYSALSNENTGKYLVSLPSGKNYGISVNKEGYMFHSENFDIPSSSGYLEVEKNIDLMNVEIGSKIILRNVFFDFDKATLRDESETELNRLIKFLNTYSSVRVEISGHTDSRGSDEYNQSLSQNRAQSVVNYLIINGIDKTRLAFKGYGESQPMASNDTDQGRQLNRRVESKIIGK